MASVRQTALIPIPSDEHFNTFNPSDNDLVIFELFEITFGFVLIFFEIQNYLYTFAKKTRMHKIFSSNFSRYRWHALAVIATVVFFAVCLQYSYLLFHIFVEIFSIVISFILFIITWNSRRYIQNSYLIFIGVMALPIGILDTFHAITYQDMNIINSEIFYANQFWIATRFLESIAILIGFLFLKSKNIVKIEILLVIVLFLTTLIIFSILYWKIFPICYIDNAQTNFKIISEYVIIFILGLSLFLLNKNKESFDNTTFRLLTAAIVFAIITEFCFTLYISNFGIVNQIGHFAKLLTFYFIYKANIVAGFIKPTELLFKNLKASEEKYRMQTIELQEMNNEYIAINEELKTNMEELHILNENIINQNKNLDELNATKDKFFSILAHDLKNPFNVLLGFTELLNKNAQKYSNEQIQQFAKAMLQTTKQTYSLLENLLEWSRLQMGNFKVNPVKFLASEIIIETIDIYQAMATSKKITLKYENNKDSYIYADKEMIKTVLRNLINNALKFTAEYGTVILKTESFYPYFNFIVSDNGTGIESEFVETIFKIDIKLAKKGTSQEKGTGLGLILCKEFVEKNNGKIWVESILDKGSNFYFSIPIYEKN